MAYRRILLGTLAALALPAIVIAGGPGSTGAVALKLPAAARPTAMGGAFVGLADDLSSLTWNPAGLANVTAPELSLMHTEYLADTSYEVLGYAQPLSVVGTLAGSVHLLNYGNMPRTLERTDGMYGGLFGSATPQDLFVTAGWGTSMPPLFGLDRLKGGVALKCTFQQLSGGTLLGLGMSAGALMDLPVQGLRIGTLVDNLGALTGEGRLLPIAWAFGASFGTNLGADFRAVYAVDTRIQVDTTPQANMGIELAAFDLIMARAGWRGGGALGGVTLGGGVRYPMTWFGKTMLFKLDYANAATGELGASQRFQLSIQFGGFSTAVRLGAARIGYEGGEPVLSWKGRGPAYTILMRREDEKAFSQLTDRPIEETSYALIGLPPGHYVFRILTVDPYRPAWKGPVSKDLELTIEGPAGAPGAAPGASPDSAPPPVVPPTNAPEAEPAR